MSDYREAIEKAVVYRDMEKVKAMLSQGADINKRRGFKGITLLHIAPSLEITKELINLGAKVCVKNKELQTALHYATMYQKEIGIIKELIENGADVIAEDNEFKIPLHYTVRNNKDSAVALLLLSKGAEANLIDIQYRSPLHYAAMNDREYKLIKELLSYGAKVDGTDIQGRTPLHYAAINSTDHLGIHEMLKYGADPNAKDKKGRTPLHYVIMNNRKYSLAEELLNFGANVNVCDDSGYTPLYLAVESECRNLKVIQKLLEGGANINIGRDEFWPFYSYCTALEKALFKRDLDCAKLLIKITLLKNFDINNKECLRLDRFIEYPDHNKLLGYEHECFCELSKMTVEQISNKFTLYEFVTMKNEYKKPLYISSLIQHQILSNYSIYKDIIMSRLQHCLKRASLLQKMECIKISGRSYRIEHKRVSSHQKMEQVKISGSRSYRLQHHLVTREIFLNFDCILKLSEYLSNQDLMNCLAASMEYHDTD